MTRIFILPVLALLFASCNTLYYVPSAPQAPMFRERNEIKAGINYSQAGQVFDEQQTKGISVQGAYSITDNIGIVANYMSLRSPDSFSIRGHGNMLQLGLGYYLPVSQKFQFEVYGGYGFGQSYVSQHMFSNNVTTVEYNDYKTSKIFVQPSIGMANEVFEFAFTSGFSYIGLNRKSGFTLPGSQVDEDRINIARNPSTLLFEPAVTIRLGYKYVKFVLQGVASGAITENYIKKSDYSMHFGLQFHYAKWLQGVGKN